MLLLPPPLYWMWQICSGMFENYIIPFFRSNNLFLINISNVNHWKYQHERNTWNGHWRSRNQKSKAGRRTFYKSGNCAPAGSCDDHINGNFILWISFSGDNPSEQQPSRDLLPLWPRFIWAIVRLPFQKEKLILF